MSNSCKAKAPFRYGVQFLSAANLGFSNAEPKNDSKPEISAETPVEDEKIVEEPVVAEEVVEEPTQVEAETAEIVAKDAPVALADAGFSAKSVQVLEANNINTVEELVAFLETGETLESLPKIGKVAAKKIEEELEQWKSAAQPSQEQLTQDS